ncbi:growth hormone secretagogue receptor type 1-like [Antedon mediterranea]|uniref:growth hormone secretagogue receptor type 1-like n=1 Tax=Antedon mediterranea TaxID=105859 RepID=UPI003AF97106
MTDTVFDKYIHSLNYLCETVKRLNTSAAVLDVYYNVQDSLEPCTSDFGDMCHVNSSAHDPDLWITSDLDTSKCMYDATDVILNGLVGPKTNGKNEMIFYVLVVGILCIAGLIGNALTISVILRTKSLQTSINYYLLCLAVSDLVLVTLTGPREIFSAVQYRPWIFGTFFCVGHYYIIDSATYCTIMCITAVTIERYVAICHPIKAKSILSKNRTKKVIIPIWIIGYTISSPLLLAYEVVTFIPGVSESKVCTTKTDVNLLLNYFYMASAVFLFVLPMSTMTVLYMLIARTLSGKYMNINLRRSSALRPSNKIKHTDKIQEDDKVDVLRRQVVKLLAIVAICFLICWLPYHLIRVSPIFGFENWSDSVVNFYYKYCYPLSITFLYISAMINPILYNMMSKKFRHAFMDMIFGRCRRRLDRKCYNSITRTQMTSISSPV